MSSWTEEEIEEDALRFRRLIGIDDAQVWIDAPTLLFKLQHYFGISYLRLANNDLPEPGGQWDAKNRLLKLNESVFAGANGPNPNPRCRYTIAHEASHAALGDQGIRNRSPYNSIEKKSSGKIKSIESRADYFAAAILAPLHLIEPHENAESVALRFGLSITAGKIRVDQAAKLYRRKNGINREVPEKIQVIISQLKNRAWNKK